MESDNYSVKEMYKVAGKDLVERIMELFENEKNCLKWFYSPNKGLGDKAPYYLCKKGQQSEVDDLIGRLEHGIFS